MKAYALVDLDNEIAYGFKVRSENNMYGLWFLKLFYR